MKNWFILILLFTYLIDPYKQGFIFGYLILLFLILNKSNPILNLDKLGSVILLFSLVYGAFYTFNPDLGVQFIFIYTLFPTAFYVLGKYLYAEDKVLFKSTKGLVLLGFVFSLSALISVSASILENGYTILTRNVNNFWTGLEENATYTGGFFLLNMCIPGIILIGWKKFKLLHKIVLIAAFTFTLFCVLRLGSRTQLVISIFSIFVALLYIVARQTTKKNFVYLIILFVIANIGYGYINIDKDSQLISAYTNRMESKKYGANTAGGRTERWEKSFEYLFQKPLGWSLDEFGYSHNLWLDVLRVGGIISFLLLVIVTILSFKMLFQNLVFEKKNKPYLGSLFIYIIAFNLLFLVEPIFESYFEVFVLHCLYIGLLSGYNERTRITNQNNLEKTISE